MDDYFQAYYGPAAEPAKKLFERFEKNWVKYWKLSTPDKPRDSFIGLGTPAEELQRLAWTKVYSRDEMKNIAAMIAVVERAASMDPVYAKRANLLRPWILDVMKMERAEVMEKEEARGKIVAIAPELRVAPPTIADWKKSPTYALIPANRLQKSLAASGQFRLTRHGDTLYLRAELKEPLLANSLTKGDRKSGDPKIWRDNDLEVFLYSPEKKDLWQIIVNDQGKWSSQRINAKGARWLPLDKFVADVQPIPHGWLVEAAIPLKQFGDGELRFNLTRERRIKGQPTELSTWSPLAKVGNWHNLECYGTILDAGATKGTGE